jgi:hypothetical protein
VPAWGAKGTVDLSRVSAMYRTREDFFLVHLCLTLTTIRTSAPQKNHMRLFVVESTLIMPTQS